jgi:hypothetical protein
VPFPGLRIFVDNPTPVICAVRPSGIGDPLVFTVFRIRDFLSENNHR